MKLIAYTRVSTLKQVKGYGLDIQKEEIKKFAQAHGHDIVEFYEEQESAIKERPIFNKSLQALQNADGLIVYRLDRLGRSVFHIAKTVKEINDMGKKLIAITDNIDTSTPQGRLHLNVLASLAEYERELFFERTRAGIERAKREGKICHRPPKPIDESLLISLKEKGVSINKIAKALGVSRMTVVRRLRKMGTMKSNE